MDQKTRNFGWTVALSGTGINLALGVLYTWSVISKAIPQEWGWNEAQRALPYSVACIVFALVMVAAGRMQDKVGPRIVATVGGILTGLGFLLASASSSLMIFVLGFGILAGSGIGFGYASATPPAVKWFPPARTGLIAGIVVAGFGLASVYAAPLARYLIGEFGIQTSMRIFGIAFLIVVVALAQFLRNPPKGYVHPPGKASLATANRPAASAGRDYAWLEMMRTPQFYLLWFMFACGSGAGLMIIGKLAKIVELQSGSKAGFILVALLAVGNASGRIIAGVLSDRMGRTATMFVVFCVQAVLMFTLRLQSQLGMLVAYSMLIGFNYGACLSLFPSATKDYFGLKNFGVNYGLVFTAWGVGGLVLPILSGRIFDATGSFNQAYFVAGLIMILAAGVTFATKAPHEETVAPSLRAAL